MVEKTVSTEARTAAHWWADKVRNGSKLDNGDQSEVGGMTMMMGMMLQGEARDRISEEAIQAFEDKLAALVEDGIKDGGTFYLDVDYGPDLTLREAAKELGDYPGEVFPWKTTMWIKTGSVKVSYGYRAPTEEIPLLES